MRGSVEDWATESLLAARQAYQVPETRKRLKPGEKLADAYQEASAPPSYASGFTRQVSGSPWFSTRFSWIGGMRSETCALNI